MKKKIFYILSFYTVLTVLGSCTKLNEEILDETSSTGTTDKEIAEGILAPICYFTWIISAYPIFCIAGNFYR